MMTLTKEDLAAIEGLFTGKFESIDQRFEAMDQRFETMDQRLEAMDRHFDTIDMRLENMESDISKLKVGQQLIKKEIYKISKQVDMTYDLALENWGQIEESKKRIAALEG